ncbi:hypothetical protein ABK040_008033 [Willaertia magna]
MSTTKDNTSSTTSSQPTEEDKKKGEESEDIVVGICHSTKERFKVPLTYDCLDNFKNVNKWKELPVIFEISLILIYSVSLFSGLVPKWVFLVNYIFWRLAYNCGLGYILNIQSKDRKFTKFIEKLIKDNKEFLNKNLSLRGTTEGKVEHLEYNVDKYPLDFTAWMVYRTIVDIILSSDLAGYIAFCLAYFELPTQFGLFEIFSYTIGILLCLFNLWAKSDAHRVLGDYAWYWGDFFFLIDKDLVFDGIFQMFPHPMYSVGYSFYYGVSLMSGSHVVLVVSFCAHMLQLIFLVFIENPHIEKIYGGMKPEMKEEEEEKVRDPIVFYRLEPFKDPNDLFLIVITLYAGYTCLTSNFYVAIVHTIVWRLIHSVGLGFILYKQSKNNFIVKKFKMNKELAFNFWKRIYNFSLTINHVVIVTLALKIIITTFFIPGYGHDIIGANKYNEYYYEGFEFSWSYTLQFVAGIMLILLNIYQSTSTFEVLGDYGWFYGDFFDFEKAKTHIVNNNHHLNYTGIYRYLNNPEVVLGHCAYFGLALISKSWVVFGLAVLAQFASYLFVNLVEKPHMETIYGKQNLRESGGIEQELQKVVSSPNLQKVNVLVKEKVDEVKKNILLLANNTTKSKKE